MVKRLLARRRVDNVIVSHISMKNSTPEQIISGQDVVILLIRPKDPHLDDFLEYYAWATDASEGRSIKVLKLTDDSPELEEVRRLLKMVLTISTRLSICLGCARFTTSNAPFLPVPNSVESNPIDKLSPALFHLKMRRKTPKANFLSIFYQSSFCNLELDVR
ncbi:MAG: hypothetical protein IPJ71_19070 [Bdellovibrionales bacterium]|nr:hypothetical protein [Bdellovibrionales bacterium]